MSPSLQERLDLSALTALVSSYAADAARWRSAVQFDEDHRFYTRLHADDRVDVWLLTWLTTQSTDLHDHGGSAAAFAVVSGTLEETRVDEGGRLTSYLRRAGDAVALAPDVIHDVRHAAGAAVSIHAYSPPLTGMTFYGSGLDGWTSSRTLSSRAPEFEESL